MRRISNSIHTDEEKAAKKLTQAIQDLNLDIERVGWYVANAMPHLHYSRLIEVMESAQYQKAGHELSKSGYYYEHRV